MSTELQEERDAQCILKADEFKALRDEIMVLTQSRHTYMITMYTLCTTILGLSIEANDAVLSLLVFLVALVFQTAINKNYEGCSRISAYIQVFLEEDKNQNWHWEFHRFFVNSYVWKKSHYNNMKKLYNLVTWNGTLIFGIASVVICIVQYKNNRTVSNQWIVITSIIFTVVLSLVNNRQAHYGDDMCKYYYDSMMEYRTNFTPADRYEENRLKDKTEERS